MGRNLLRHVPFVAIEIFSFRVSRRETRGDILIFCSWRIDLFHEVTMVSFFAEQLKLRIWRVAVPRDAATIEEEKNLAARQSPRREAQRKLINTLWNPRACSLSTELTLYSLVAERATAAAALGVLYIYLHLYYSAWASDLKWKESDDESEKLFVAPLEASTNSFYRKSGRSRFNYLRGAIDENDGDEFPTRDRSIYLWIGEISFSLSSVTSLHSLPHRMLDWRLSG